MGISLHGGSVGQPGVGSSTRDFERWLKGVLEVGRLSLWELCEGNLERRLHCWGTPKDMLSKALELESVPIGAPLLVNMEGHSFLRAFDMKRYIKRGVKMPCKRVSP